MPLVFACIAPHGSIAIPDAKPKARPTLASATTAGMQELGRRFTAAEPDVSIVLTPHNIHIEGAMAVIDAGTVSGDLLQWGNPISMSIPIDRELTLSVRDAIRQAGIPIVAASYGGNDPVTAVLGRADTGAFHGRPLGAAMAPRGGRAGSRSRRWRAGSRRSGERAR